jgi:hypothetical protein
LAVVVTRAGRDGLPQAWRPGTSRPSAPVSAVVVEQGPDLKVVRMRFYKRAGCAAGTCHVPCVTADRNECDADVSRLAGQRAAARSRSCSASCLRP